IGSLSNRPPPFRCLPKFSCPSSAGSKIKLLLTLNESAFCHGSRQRASKSFPGAQAPARANFGAARNSSDNDDNCQGTCASETETRGPGSSGPRSPIFHRQDADAATYLVSISGPLRERATADVSPFLGSLRRRQD